VRINLTDVEVRDFEAIPAGKYIVEFTDYEDRETKGGENAKLPAGTPMINWEMTIVRNVNGDETHKGRRVWMNTIIHERTLFNLKGVLLACGWNENDLQGEIDFEQNQVIGNQVVANVTRREYPPESGNFTNDVRNVKSVATAAKEESSSLLP
jgi:hypothetical protein